MYYYARLICKASVYKLFSELFLATSCPLYADAVPLRPARYVNKIISFTNHFQFCHPVEVRLVEFIMHV